MSDTGRSKFNIPFCMAAVLLFLTLVSTHFTGSLYARYVTTDNAQDDARVAQFEVAHQGDVLTSSLELAIVPGEHKYYIMVDNASEVAVNCEIKVENRTDNLPLKFTVYEDGATPPVPETGSFTMSDDIDVGSGDGYYLLVVFPQENAENHINKLDIVDISVSTSQID